MKPTRDTQASALPMADLSIGQIAQRSGVAISALHFYEAKGLISAFRNAGNQRRYPRGVLRRVALIKTAQALGLSLKEIKDALSTLPSNRAPSKADWSALAKRWRKDLDARIAQLTRLRDQLGGCIGCGCLSMRDCPLRNPDDKVGRKGPGAHFL